MAKTLLEVLDEQGVKTYPTSQGRSVAHCPFHENDREPSFTIYPDNKYWCFGCRAWGNPVKFMVDFKGWSAKEALEYVGVDYTLPQTEKRAIKIKNTLKTGKFVFETAKIYNEYLLEESGPQKYLIDRGLTVDTMKRFLLGYTDGGVIDFNFATEYEMANEIGLLNKAGAESLAHRITIPNIVDKVYADFMIGRTVINDRIKYLGLRMPKPIMGFYDFRNSPILFLVEGNFDYLLLRQWGYPAIVMSGSHIPKGNKHLLRNKMVVIVPDNDVDLSKGAAAALEIKRTIPTSHILDYKHLGVKDIGELGEKSNGKELFDAVVQEQLWNTPFLNPAWSQYLPTSLDLIRLPSI